MPFASIVAASAIAIALVLIVAHLLPARHRAVRQAAFPASPATLYALVATPPGHPAWCPAARRLEILPPADGNPRFRERLPHGDVTLEVVHAATNRELVVEIASRSAPVVGSWTYELTPVTAGGTRSTTLRITEDGAVHSPIFRLSRLVAGPHATIDAYLRDVGAKLGVASVNIDSPS